MKKLLLLLAISTAVLFGQSGTDTDAIVFFDSGSLAVYSVENNTTYTELVEIGPTPNQIYFYNNYIFVVNSGEWGANTSLQYFPAKAVFEYLADGNQPEFENKVTTVMLSANGNAWEAAGINDSLVAVTATQIGKVDVVNYKTGELVNSVSIDADGNPQGILYFNGKLVAAMSDWSDPNLGQGHSAAIIDPVTLETTGEIEAHINATDVIGLTENKAVINAWGTWFGDDNYGTLTLINDSFEAEHIWEIPADGKAEFVLPLDESTFYMRGFDVDYAPLYGIVNFENYNYEEITEGFYTKNITGKLLNGSLFAVEDGVTNVYDDSFGLVTTFDAEIGIYNVPLNEASVPVELVSFTSISNNGNIVLNWETATETNNSGFAVERKAGSGNFETVAFVEGAGTSTENNRYQFTDNNAISGIYYYRLKQIDYDGTYEYSNVIEVNTELPDNYLLSQNYPNPFNPATTIKFSIPESGMVKVSVFNVLGEEVATLVNEFREAGTHEVKFNATGLNSGIYFCRFESDSFSDIKKMMLVK